MKNNESDNENSKKKKKRREERNFNRTDHRWPDQNGFSRVSNNQDRERVYQSACLVLRAVHFVVS